MNSSEQPGNPSQRIQSARGKLRQRKGVALILVVSFIVLLSALVVGFFSRVTTDLTGARSYAEGVSARQLAESAVSVVMGQIRAATTIPNGCWASQPGMIRVYGTKTGASSQAYRFYKLYSSHNMVLTDKELNSFDPKVTAPGSGAKAEVPLGTGGWLDQPAFFTDLNEPADVNITDPVTGQTKPGKRFPIFDPSVSRIKSIGQNTSAKSNGSFVEGSEITLPSGKDLRRPDTKGNLVTYAPMPVRWIYVLRDGTLTAPTPLTGSGANGPGLKAAWSNTAATSTPSTGVPTKDNPIVGRIAFWADDDTCKVNINTASGFITDESVTPDYRVSQVYKSKVPMKETNPAFIPGSFWDTPRIQTWFEKGINGDPVNYRPGLSNSQPVRNEFQRYPGHPSTTSLGLVLQGLLPKNALDSEKMYDLTPRLMSGEWKPGESIPTGSLAKNSEGGTRQLIVYGQTLDPANPLDPDPPCTEKYTFDPVFNTKNPYTPSDAKTWSYHLLSSVDELYYSTLNDDNPNTTRTTTDKQLKLSKVFTPDVIDKARFFLTAHNRSSELNLFGRPRVSIWPVPTAYSEQTLQKTKNPVTGLTGIRNPSDDLIRFCSTIGGDPNKKTNDPSGTIRRGEFIFDREDPFHISADFNRSRNFQIFNYLRELTSNNKGKIPGWGQSFEGKYASGPGGMDQILMEIFDYIRTVNLKDTSRDEIIDKTVGRKAPAPYTSTSQRDRANQLKGTARYAPRGIVVPTMTTIGGHKVSGFGRFPTITEVSLVFYHGGYTYKSKKNPKQPEDVEYDYTLVDERNYNSIPAAKKWQDTNELTGKLIRAFLVFETFNPMQGYGPVTDLASGSGARERIIHDISNLQGFTIKTTKNPKFQSLGLPNAGRNDIWRSSGSTWAGRNFGGTEGFFHTLQDKTCNILPKDLNPFQNITDPTYPWGGYNPPVPNYKAAGSLGTDVKLPPSNLTNAYYPFQTPCYDKFAGIKIPIVAGKPGEPPTEEETTFVFGGGSFDLTVRYKDDAHDGLANHDEAIQKFHFLWPPAQSWPMPITEREAKVRGQGYRYQSNVWQFTTGDVNNKYDFGGFNRYIPGFDTDDPTSNWGAGGSSTLRWTDAGGYRMPYHLPLRIAWAAQHSWSPWASYNGKFDKNGNQATNLKHYTNRFLQILQPGDTIRSLIPSGTQNIIPKPSATDPRATFLQSTQAALTPSPAPSDVFGPHPDYLSTRRRAQTLRRGDGGFYFDADNPVFFSDDPDLAPGAFNPLTGNLAAIGNTRYIGGYGPDLPKRVTATRSDGGAADFDTGIGNLPDGPFCGKADEGNIARAWYDDQTKTYHYVQPYFSTWAYDAPGDTYFSPNRQIPSPVMFGSLLAPWMSSWKDNGWKTLLFCPNPAGANHPGGGQQYVPDHLLLDLFSMPVVEPYAISEPSSTDGKVNLNYQMMPFGYIERSTALRAALQPLRIAAIPNDFTRVNSNDKRNELKYKGVDNDQNLRYLVDRDETLAGFKAFFDKYSTGQPGEGFFKSASQVCEMYLYPKGTPINYSPVTFNGSNIKNWWAQCAVTGDNLREKPYSDLYSRVTTKSNTYTVHYRVQSLRQRPYTGDPAGEAAYYKTWDESRDQVLSEYRGHTTIERYIDSMDGRFYGQDKTIPKNQQIDPDKDSLESAYRFRVIYNKRFSPW